MCYHKTWKRKWTRQHFLRFSWSPFCLCCWVSNFLIYCNLYSRLDIYDNLFVCLLFQNVDIVYEKSFVYHWRLSMMSILIGLNNKIMILLSFVFTFLNVDVVYKKILCTSLTCSIMLSTLVGQGNDDNLFVCSLFSNVDVAYEYSSIRHWLAQQCCSCW